MKRVFCPKCDHQITFDEKKYEDGQVVPMVCPACASQFKIKIGRKVVRNKTGEEKEVREADFSCGSIVVIENAFAFKQELPLAMGENVVGRRNKDTDGVNVEIITSEENKEGGLDYFLRDFPSLTGTFLRNELLGDRETVRLEDGDVITLGATTFILRTAGSKHEEENL